MSPGEIGASIDELLDRAVRASNDGDRATAAALAGQVLAVDHGNPEAEDLLTPPAHYGEIRRLTIMFADLVDSTALSTRLEPETYHALVGRYRDDVHRIVDRYEGHITSVKGDGLLAVFGHPRAHENDVRRAVAAGLDITRAVAQLSEQAQRTIGVAISVRVGVHRGLVYLDVDQDDVYGFAANLAARLCSVAGPDTVAVSDAVAPLVGDVFELDTLAPVAVKGIDTPVGPHRVLGERPDAPPLDSPPLIGRGRERDWLRRSWERARAGTLDTAGIVFCGEPGIGKTRLATEAAEMVEGSGATVIELRGSPLHTDTGLHPVRRLVERRCGITRLTDDAERLRLLEAELNSCAMDPESSVPLLAPVLGIGPEHGYRPAAVEGRTLYEMIGEAVRRYVLACLRDRPGLVVAEDAHWFDPSTMELINALLATADGHLMVVVTGRDGEWSTAGWPSTVFELAPLSDEQSDALIDALDPTVSQARRAAVRERCDGVPFYIERVVAGLGAAGHDATVPDALYEPLLAQLRSHSGVVPVVEAAAVIGRAGDLPLLRTVARSNGIDVDDVVTELVGANVLQRSGDVGWRFRHELLREVAAELAPPSLKRELHSRTARALVEGSSVAEPDWRLIATHFERAQQHDEAADAYRKASVAARRRGALHEALAYLTTALGQLAACPDGPARDRKEIAIRLERGFLAGTTRGTMSGEGPADFQRCLELASTGDHQDGLFTTLTAMVSYYLPRAELRRAHELLDSLSTRITAKRPWSGPVLASTLGSVVWLEGDFPTARRHLLRALADRSAADPRVLETAWWVAVDPISSAHFFLALTHTVCGDLDRAEAHLAESARRCDALTFPQNVHNRAHTLFAQIWVKLESDRPADAAALVAELRRQSEESGLDLWRLVGATQHATVKALAALDADADAATLTLCAEKLARLVDGSRLLHLNSYLTFHDAVIGRLLVAAGEPEEARERLEAALRHADETGMHFHDAELMRARAHTFAGRVQRRDALLAALEFARRQNATLFELRCLLDFFELDAGGDRLDLADALRRFTGDDRWPEVTRARQILS
ncbi:ATP-binding protein [Mycobacterium parmense]|uniref:Adenylate cyclase n=1 Tax=Mycobacterium parmense TaxID=185642 RepID=A0A7I7YYP9_9MYCO|nr:adenylate/guanylate cyclase domain-containing protein [Mycobacterium parmense]MCV7350442.1 AAA family ATPase [Mycobacterium parmense]ORW48176.1 adenylyl cyclase [Mycobacterium parmense]BBZ46134.1 adenylate cyclase [Mycobacterium parmense]